MHYIESFLLRMDYWGKGTVLYFNKFVIFFVCEKKFYMEVKVRFLLNFSLFSPDMI